MKGVPRGVCLLLVGAGLVIVSVQSRIFRECREALGSMPPAGIEARLQEDLSRRTAILEQVKRIEAMVADPVSADPGTKDQFASRGEIGVYEVLSQGIKHCGLVREQSLVRTEGGVVRAEVYARGSLEGLLGLPAEWRNAGLRFRVQSAGIVADRPGGLMGRYILTITGGRP
jgi:hypothetical protein